MTPEQYEDALGDLGDALTPHKDLRHHDLALLTVGIVQDAYFAFDEALYERRGLLKDLAEADSYADFIHEESATLLARIEELESGA